MDNVVDIVNLALDKNPLGMRDAIDTELASRIGERLNDMRVDVASSLFGVTAGEPADTAQMEPSTEG